MAKPRHPSLGRRAFWTLGIVALWQLIAVGYAQESICARVKIEIIQELTLEREAFEARMTINNGLISVPLTDIEVDVNFADKNGLPVRATTNPNNTNAVFFIRLQNGSSIPANIPGGTSNRITWLIIPARGAAGSDPQGELYSVGATLTYRAAGESNVFQVTPDTIFVKPLPDLALDYFLRSEVYGDDPFTENYIEPVVPFYLGVRVKNAGFGAARKLKIESGQPRIIDNQQGLLVDFRITGSEVNGRPASSSLLADFGDIAPQRSGVARWIMTSTLSGRFVEFTANYTHADELGGELTSLISGKPRTHFTLGDVLVDLPGRDTVRDFLAKDGNTLRVYESENADTTVADLSGSSSLAAHVGGRYLMRTLSSSGFIFMKLPNPLGGAQQLRSATRADGKPINPANAWQSQTWDRDARRWNYFVNVFDVNNTAGHTYTLQYEVPPPLSNRAPRLDLINNWTLSAGNFLSFPVTAFDPDGNRLTFNLDTNTAPVGATLAPATSSSAVFMWRPTQADVPSTNVIMVRVTDDGTPPLSDIHAFTITVEGNTKPSLSTIPDYVANVLRTLLITNSAIDSDLPANVLTYTLEPGFPEGARVNLTNGVFSWTPKRDQAPSTNLVTLTVTDNGLPPLNDTKSFHVSVNDFVELTLGSTLVQAGGTGAVPVTVYSSAPITNVQFAVDLAEGRFTDWMIEMNGLFSATGALSLVSTRLLLSFGADHDFIGTQHVGQLVFISGSNQSSAFLSLLVGDVAGTRSDGMPVPWALQNSGRVTLLANEALLEAFLDTNSQRRLILYGKPGTNYIVENAFTLSSPAWAPVAEVLLTNFSRTLLAPGSTNMTIFYRARE